MKQHNTVLPAQRGTERQPTRQDIGKQIIAITANIRKNLTYTANLAKRGEFERASKIAEHVTKMKARLYVLGDGYVSLNGLDPIIATERPFQPAKNHTVIDRKTYKRFGKK